MFGDLLKELRARKSVTQTDLAAAIGVSNGNVGDWERGRSKPGFDAIIALSRYFEISPARILGIPTLDQSYTCDGIPLSELEADLLAMYRLLDKRNQEDIFDYVKLKYQKMTGEKGSIFSTYEDTKKPQKSDPESGSGIA